MQIAAEDTHANYVICRGWDPRFRKFFDYVDADDDKIGISVAKPYGSRYVGAYQIGQIFPAFIPKTVEVTDTPFGPLGENPGVAETSTGHPADLDETVELLYDDDSRVICWMLLDGGAWPWFRGKLDGDLAASSSATVSIYIGDVDTGQNVTAYSPKTQSETVSSGSWVRIEWHPAEGKWFVTMAPCE